MSTFLQTIARLIRVALHRHDPIECWCERTPADDIPCDCWLCKEVTR